MEKAPIKRYGKVSFFGFGPMSLLDGKAYRLKYELEKFSNVTETLRRQLQEEVKAFPQFLNMNMAILALALVILFRINEEGDEVELDKIRQYLDLYIDPEYPPRDKEKAAIGLRKKEDVFRYIHLVIEYREHGKESLY